MSEKNNAYLEKIKLKPADNNDTIQEAIKKALSSRDSKSVNADNISIEDYLFKTLGIDKDSLSHMSSDIFQKNFTHLMCHVIEDIQEIDVDDLLI